VIDKDAIRELIKASFSGDRSAAGRYAAEQRWKGHAKDDISNQVTVGFESEGKDRGTVWATDKATGKVVGALRFDANFIGKIYVAKDYRRRGIASFLYNEAKKRNGGVEMKADDYTVSGAGFMSAVTGKEVFQTGDNSWVGMEWKSWLERLERDALEKASFGGNRSEAGRYAANMRWRGQGEVAGFIGQSKYKLGADGSIHPKALMGEMASESQNVFANKEDVPSSAENEDLSISWKSLVCKNIATNMTDVSATEILDVVDGFQASNKNGLTVIQADHSRSIREIADGTVKKFILGKDGTVIDASKESFVARRMKSGQPSPTKETLLARYWDNASEGGQIFDSDTPEGQIALKQATVKPLVDAWAKTSNDGATLSLAIQDTAQQVFKPNAVSWNPETQQAENKFSYSPSTTITDASTKVFSSFLKAQYAATQQYFDSKGIKEVTLFRGMKQPPIEDIDYDGDDSEESNIYTPQQAEITMRPLSSWSTNLDVANDFAGNAGANYRGGILAKARIKTKDILSIPYTGIGCLGEDEVVVIGHSVQGEYRAPYVRTLSSTTEYLAQQFDYRTKEVEPWAFADETGVAP
jgi:GNAT superfamily N-acetyltransferase